MALTIKPIEIVQQGKHKLLVVGKHWERVDLLLVANVQNGYAFKSELFTHSEGMPLIRIRDIENDKTENFYSGDFSTDFIVNKGDILIGMDGDFRASIWHGESGLLNQRVCRLLPISDFFSTNFLFLCLQPYLNAINAETSSVTVKHLSSRTIGEIPLPLPPLNEQHRIVAKIEALFSELDKGIESFNTAREQLKIYRQALLKHAFSGKLTEQWRKINSINCDWHKTKLGSLLDFLTSGSRGWAQYYSECGDIFIRAQNLKYDYLDLSERAYVSLPEHTEGLRTRVQIGDLLITITGANVTKSALVDRDLGVAYVSQHVALCRPTREILPKYLYWFVVAEADGRKQLSDAAYGAGKPGLNLENIRSVIIDVPCLLEQKAIVELIEEKLSVVDQLDQTITTALQQAEALRQSILKKAFSGQLVPQDPSDEPASVLLERIRAEKAQADTQPARRRGKTA